MSNKILITGSSGGIGKAISNKLVSSSNNIIIFTSSNLKNLDNLKKLYGDKHYYYMMDMSNMSQLPNDLEKINKDHKDIEILINNAGITDDSLMLRMNWSKWNKVIDTNLNSNFHIIKSILPNMIKNRKGKILGISSIVAHTGNPGQTNYASSKAGMIAMYKSLALEVAQRNINVNIISPGFIKTPMTDKLNQDLQKNMLKMIPMNRFGDPNDVANLVNFLISNESDYITGQTFHVNGGMLML